MRILNVVSDGRAGSGRVAFDLGQGLRAAGHDVGYAATRRFFKFFGLASDEGFNWMLRPTWKSIGRDLADFNRRAASADLVITHDSGSRHFTLAAKGLGLKSPLWFMRHAISSTSRLGAVQLYRLLVDHQITVSDAIRESVVRAGYPAERTTRIYGGARLGTFRAPDPRRVARRRRDLLADLAPGTVVIGMVARLGAKKDGPGKGYDILLKALAAASFPYRVLVLGPHDREATDAIREMAASHGADPGAFRFPGFVRDMPSFYPLMDINVLPSRAEGLGLALIEGMAAGVASVGSRSGGITEIIDHGDTGLLFEQGDDRGLAKCLEELVADPVAREAIAHRGQASVMGRFDAPVMVAAFCDLLARQGFTRTGDSSRAGVDGSLDAAKPRSV